MNGKHYHADPGAFCELLRVRDVPEPGGALRALGKPATGAQRVYPVVARCHYVLTTIVGPGDPFNRHPILVWNVDEGTAVVTVTTGPNDVESLVVSGGAPISNRTRWDTLTFRVSKTNSGNEWHIWQCRLSGSEIGYGRWYANLGNPITDVGRNGRCGPIWSDHSRSLTYEYEGATVPSNNSVEYRWSAVGWSTEDGELPPICGGDVIPWQRGLGTEVG